MPKLTHFLFMVAALSATVDAAQAQHVNHAVPAAAKTTQPVLPAPAASQERADTTITIRTVGSDLEFLPSEIAVKAGKRVRIRYINNGTYPHNLVLVRTDDDIDALGLAAFQANATGYVPMKEKDRMIAYSELAEPGKTVEFTFVVPPAGDYPFVCLYPGHYNMMLGKLKSLK